jgi:hypothetical protein
MTETWEEEETWEEDGFRRVLEPLAVRVSVQAAGSQAGAELRESARRLLVFRLHGPSLQPVPFA